MQRLGAGEWFTARVSACGLFHIAYPSASESHQAELRAIYNQLCHDDLPMVRRSAASNLGKFAATVEPSHLKSDILSYFRDLTQDGILHKGPFSMVNLRVFLSVVFTSPSSGCYLASL
jgi:serine/threonine-protein phosphatase 2A regulatory subunit A